MFAIKLMFNFKHVNTVAFLFSDSQFYFLATNFLGIVSFQYLANAISFFPKLCCPVTCLHKNIKTIKPNKNLKILQNKIIFLFMLIFLLMHQVTVCTMLNFLKFNFICILCQSLLFSLALLDGANNLSFSHLNSHSF